MTIGASNVPRSPRSASRHLRLIHLRASRRSILLLLAKPGGQLNLARVHDERDSILNSLQEIERARVRFALTALKNAWRTVDLAQARSKTNGPKAL